MSELLRRFRRATEPRRGATDRLRARHVATEHLLSGGLREPPPGALRRLIDRLEAPRPRRVPGYALALVAAVAALAVLSPWTSGPRALQEHLAAEVRVEQPLTGAVHIAYVGTGEVSGTDAATHVDWEVGLLEVEVDPAAGVAFDVTTAEARVSVVGTRFSVDRGPLGTRVGVQRGRVKVACEAGERRTLQAGDELLCLPARAGGMLGRARALRAAGAPAAEVLAALDRGLALATPGDAVVGELIAMRLGLLVDEGRYDEALDAAEAYLAGSETARRDEVSAIAEALRARARDPRRPPPQGTTPPSDPSPPPPPP